jgi:hypothetical protein
MVDVYAQMDKHFARTAAWVVLKDGKPKARILVRYPADGASRLHAYVHWWGLAALHGKADGYGYDKRGAAIQAAVRNAAERIRRERAADREGLDRLVPKRETADLRKATHLEDEWLVKTLAEAEPFFAACAAGGEAGTWKRDVVEAGFVTQFFI